MKIIWHLRREFNKEIKTLKRTQPEVQTELENPVTQLDNAKESLAGTMNQAGDRVSELEDKVEYSEQNSKEYEKFS